METYGKILLVAMPAFLALVLFEKWYGWYKGNDTVRNMDMVSSLTSGITNVTKDVLSLSIVVLSYPWMVEHWSLMQIQNSFLVYLLAFIALDFAGYWIHRLQHEYNLLWNSHIVHHSSEEFNLACALRQSISSIIKIFTIFLLPAALLGVPADAIAIVAPLHLFAQFWYHTRHIGHMGVLEKIIVTPSHHRVHHAINPQYLDKNYSQIFIFWDKLFGTFQKELKEVPPVYGITRPVHTWNPIKINFMHLWLLLQDAWRTRSWKDKLRIWWMPTGWRPADTAEKYPVYKIEDPYNFPKYETSTSPAFGAWVWFQLLILLLLISWLFGRIAAIGSPAIFEYGAFIFLCVYALTELMDHRPSALLWDLLKISTGIWLMQRHEGWFGIHEIIASGNTLLIVYFIISFAGTAYFAQQHWRNKSMNTAHLKG